MNLQPFAESPEASMGDTETNAARDTELEELRAIVAPFKGFAPLQVDLRIEGRIRGVIILAREEAPLFTVV